MQPDHLSRLKAAGVWPEGLVYREIDPPFREHFWREQGGIIPEPYARAAIIDKMMDELPMGLALQPGVWMVEKTWRIYEPLRGETAISHNPDKFLALFDALVASGRVK